MVTGFVSPAEQTIKTTLEKVQQEAEKAGVAPPPQPTAPIPTVERAKQEELRRRFEKKRGRKKKTTTSTTKPKLPIAAATIIEAQLAAAPETAKQISLQKSEEAARAKLTTSKQQSERQKRLQELQRGRITQTIIPTGLPVSFQKDVTQIGDAEPGERVLQITPGETTVIKEKLPERPPAKKTFVEKVREQSVRLGEEAKKEIVSGVQFKDPRQAGSFTLGESITGRARSITKGVLSVGLGAGASLLEFGTGIARFGGSLVGPQAQVTAGLFVFRTGERLKAIGETLAPKLKESRTFFEFLGRTGEAAEPVLVGTGIVAAEAARRIKVQAIKSPTTVLGDVLAFQAIGRGVSSLARGISTELAAERFLTKLATQEAARPKFKFIRGKTRLTEFGPLPPGELVISSKGQITQLRQLGLDPFKPVRLLEQQQFLKPALGTTRFEIITQRKLPATIFQKGLGRGPFKGVPEGRLGTQFAKTRTQLPDILGQGIRRTESGQALFRPLGELVVSRRSITGFEFKPFSARNIKQLTLGETILQKGLGKGPFKGAPQGLKGAPLITKVPRRELVVLKLKGAKETVVKLLTIPGRKGQLQLLSPASELQFQRTLGGFTETPLKTELTKFKLQPEVLGTIPTPTPTDFITPTITAGGLLLKQTAKDISVPGRKLVQRQALEVKTKPLVETRLLELQRVETLRLKKRGTLKKKAVQKERDKLRLPPVAIPNLELEQIQKPVLVLEQIEEITQIQEPILNLQSSFQKIIQRQKARALPKVGLKLDTKPKNLFVQAFEVQVKRKGKFEVLGQKLTRFEAIAKGAKKVEETASAQFKIIQKGFVRRKNGKPVFEGFNERFREKEEGVFIEKRRFRISTPGELKEITFAPRKQKKVKDPFARFNKLGF